MRKASNGELQNLKESRILLSFFQYKEKEVIYINIINTISEIFTTRELATIIWFTIIFIYCMNNKSIKNSLKGIPKSIYKLLITVPGLIMITYVVAFGYFLYKLGFLKSTLIKDYIYWVLFGFIPIIIRVVENYKSITLSQIIKDIIKFSIVPLFIINSYTMNIIMELLIIPLACICSAALVMCDYKSINTLAKKIFNSVLIIISIFMIYYGFKGFINNINDINSIVFFKSMFIDIVCIIGVIPLIFYFRWYILYEQIGLLISFRSKLNKWVIYLVTFKSCFLIRRKLVCILDNVNEFYKVDNWRDLDNRIKKVLHKDYEVAQ